MDAVRAPARAAPDLAARGRLPPAGLAAVRLPPCPADGRADQLPTVSPQPHTHLAFEGYQYAKEQGKGNDYNHRVLEAFFVEGQDIGQIDVLTKLAGEVGLERAEFEAALADPQVPGRPPPGPAARLRGGRRHRRADVRDRQPGADRLAGPGDRRSCYRR